MANKRPSKMPSAPIKTVTRNIQGIGPLGPSENLSWGYNPPKAPMQKPKRIPRKKQ